MENSKNIDVVLLCGGLGTRISEVLKDRPKAMADFGGEPFLNKLLDFFSKKGFKRHILCVGHMADFIKNYYKENGRGLNILFSEEEELLGTGGAVKNAESLIKSETFFVANGDGFCNVDLDSFLDFHLSKKERLASMVLTRPGDRKDAGNVMLDEGGLRIKSFQEKQEIKESKKYISAGIYLFDKKVLSLIPPGEKFSLEYSLFPNLINKGFYGFVAESEIFDIGTPERLKKARAYFNAQKNYEPPK